MASKLKYYIDEHVAMAVVRGLRKRGVDVVTTKDADMLGATDEEHLVLAGQLDRIIVYTGRRLFASCVRWPGARRCRICCPAHTHRKNDREPDAGPPGADT